MFKRYLTFVCIALVGVQSVQPIYAELDLSSFAELKLSSDAITEMIKEGKIVLQPIGSTVLNLCKASKNVVCAGGDILLLTLKLGAGALITSAQVCECVSQRIAENPELVTGMLIGAGLTCAYAKYMRWSRQQAKADLRRKLAEATRDRRAICNDIGVQAALIT